MKIADKLKLISTTENTLFGGQVKTIELYEADIAYDRPITRTYIKVVKYTNPAKGSHKFTNYCNYGFSDRGKEPYFCPTRKFKTKTSAFNAAREHLIGK